MRFLLYTGAAFLVLLCTASTVNARVFTCDIKDMQRLGSDGALASNTSDPSMKNTTRAGITFDDRTGRLSGLRHTYVLSIMQHGTDDNTLLAISIHKGIGNTALEVLKINTPDGRQMPFLWIADNEITSGVCTTGGE